jgi:hypothetical protein
MKKITLILLLSFIGLSYLMAQEQKTEIKKWNDFLFSITNNSNQAILIKIWLDEKFVQKEYFTPNKKETEFINIENWDFVKKINPDVFIHKVELDTNNNIWSVFLKTDYVKKIEQISTKMYRVENNTTEPISAEIWINGKFLGEMEYPIFEWPQTFKSFKVNEWNFTDTCDLFISKIDLHEYVPGSILPNNQMQEMLLFLQTTTTGYKTWRFYLESNLINVKMDRGLKTFTAENNSEDSIKLTINLNNEKYDEIIVPKNTTKKYKVKDLLPKNTQFIGVRNIEDPFQSKTGEWTVYLVGYKK